MRARRQPVLVLCYHAVSPTWPAELSVTPERLRAQLAHVLRRGFRPVTFTEAVAGEHRDGVVAVTFDDAYHSVLTRAAPVLAELGVPGTVFAPTAYMSADQPMIWPGIDRWLGTEHEPELMPLGWPGLRRLADSGWEVGSHTVTHPHLTRLGEQELAQELERSRAACEHALGRPCTSIAYPYGDVAPAVVRAARAAGYLHGAALPGDFTQHDPLAWARVGVYRHDAAWRFRLKLSAPLWRLRASPRAGPLLGKALARRPRR